MRRGCIYRKLLTAIRRLSDEIPTDVKQSVGIPSVFSNLKRLYNGHIYLSATVTWFVGNSSENSDGIPATKKILFIRVTGTIEKVILLLFQRDDATKGQWEKRGSRILRIFRISDLYSGLGFGVAPGKTDMRGLIMESSKDICSLFDSYLPNYEASTHEITWRIFSTQLRSSSKKNQIKRSSYVTVMPLTN
ncbi:hypothetical protein YC2023_077715 [Brassica napus]